MNVDGSSIWPYKNQDIISVDTKGLATVKDIYVKDDGTRRGTWLLALQILMNANRPYRHRLLRDGCVPVDTPMSYLLNHQRYIRHLAVWSFYTNSNIFLYLIG